MTRLLFTAASALGATAIIWMAASFVGSDALALTVTAVIGIVYGLGLLELLQFRGDTRQLQRSLQPGPQLQPGDSAGLESWLQELPVALRNAVQLRIEGERVGLPAPVITPYLIGLLVMLGLLGTFVGMVETLQGAVSALEGSTELAAIRSGLRAPIEGLGLAFGTSVAGIAASAMLGLNTTLSRRDRMLATRRLDRIIATDLRSFSLSYNRQETYRALQQQAHALPDVADKLQSLSGQLERMGERLSDSLTAGQEQFHAAARDSYDGLARSVGDALQQSLAHSGQLTAAAIQPLVQETMAEMNRQAQATRESLGEAAAAQTDGMAAQLQRLGELVGESLQQGLAAQQTGNRELVAQLEDALQRLNREFGELGQSLQGNFESAAADWRLQQTEADSQRLQSWRDSLCASQEQAVERLQVISDAVAERLEQAAERQVQQAAESGAQLAGLLQQNETLLIQRQAAEQQWSEQQQRHAERFGATLQQTLEQLRSAEQERGQAASERLEALTATVAQQWEQLRNEEQTRADAAQRRMEQLQEAVAENLAQLGRALEEPMTRLIETASETPKAAAEVIQDLRQELSNSIERDNELLRERQQILTELDNLSASLAESASGQRQAVESLIGGSADILHTVGAQFHEQIDGEITQLASVAAQFAGSAGDIGALGDALGGAVQLFGENNERLLEGLGRIETSLQNSSERNDEQMAYYVAQAREIIDHSILSQKEIIEELRQLGSQREMFPAEAG